MAGAKSDLSITALYTSAVWRWGRLPGSELLAAPEAAWVFRFTNAALALARLFRRELPSLRHSLLHRHLVIDHLLRDAKPVQVLELASGLSRRGVAFSADPALRYVEVDLPHVLARKRALLWGSAEGRAALERPNLTLLAADVETAVLEPLVLSAVPLTVIAEGLLMYLPAEAQRRLWARLRRLFDLAPGMLVFDLVPAAEQPPPGRVGRALAALMKRFTGGRTFERDARTREDITAELRAAGFSQVEVLDPKTVARAWSLPFPAARTQQLIFVARP